MRGGRQTPWTKRAAWLAVLAIWLQALLPAVHHPAGMALAGGLGAADQLNFCHAPAPVSPDDPGPSDPGKAPAHSLPPCALCQAVHAIGGFAPPQPAVVEPVAAYESLAFALPADRSFTSPRRHDRQQPRAPPSLA